MKHEFLDTCFDQGWKCFCFDDESTCVLLDMENYCVQINDQIIDQCQVASSSENLRDFAAGLAK